MNVTATVWEVIIIDIMTTICSRFSTIAAVHKCVNAKYYLSAVSDAELVDAIVNVQGIVIANRLFY